MMGDACGMAIDSPMVVVVIGLLGADNGEEERALAQALSKVCPSNCDSAMTALLALCLCWGLLVTLVITGLRVPEELSTITFPSGCEEIRCFEETAWLTALFPLRMQVPLEDLRADAQSCRSGAFEVTSLLATA